MRLITTNLNIIIETIEPTESTHFYCIDDQKFISYNRLTKRVYSLLAGYLDF